MCNATAHWVGSYVKMCTVIVETSGFSFKLYSMEYSFFCGTQIHIEIVK